MPLHDAVDIGADGLAVQLDGQAVGLDEQPLGDAVAVDVLIARVLAIGGKAVGQGDIQIGIGVLDGLGQTGVAIGLFALGDLLLLRADDGPARQCAKRLLHLGDGLGVVRAEAGRTVHADELALFRVKQQVRARGIVELKDFFLRLGRLGRLCLVRRLGRLLGKRLGAAGQERGAQRVLVGEGKERVVLEGQLGRVCLLRGQERGKIGFFVICKAQPRGIETEQNAVERDLQRIVLGGLLQERGSLLGRFTGQVDAVELRAGQKCAGRRRRLGRLRLGLGAAEYGNEQRQQQQQRRAPFQNGPQVVHFLTSRSLDL